MSPRTACRAGRPGATHRALDARTSEKEATSVSEPAVGFESGMHSLANLVSLRGPNGLISLRRLKVYSVVLPAVFIGVLEVVWFTALGGRHLHWLAYAVLAIIPLVSVAVFASTMFHFIGQAQRHVLRQNCQLAAVNSVAAAVRGGRSVPQIAQAALLSVLASSGAIETSVEIAGEYAGGADEDGESRCWQVPAAGDEPPARSGQVIDVPLTSSTATIGTMRLRLPVDVRESDLLTAATLDSIGRQIGSAIQIAHLVDNLQRRKHEGHGFYDVLLRISNQESLADVLGAVTRHARELLPCDVASLCLTDDAYRLVQATAGEVPESIGATTSCFNGSGGPCRHRHGQPSVCPSRSSPEWVATMSVPLGGSTGTLGDLWISRRTGDQFTERDHGFLATMSGLAAIAIMNARMRENERQGAILAERERIAREMHDSLAQVLGVIHLQLRALDSRRVVQDAPALGAELAQLADIAEEAYRDVREAILGLREASRGDRSLLQNLRVYIEKFSQQSGIDATLVTTVDRDLVLPPRTEVQVIRVIQEALTNVRKHAAAKSVVVSINEGPVSTTFVVEDDGHGFDACATPVDRDRFGMYTMRERIRLLNGTLTVDSAPGKGTRVIAEVPVVSRAPGVVEVSGGRV